MDSNDLERERGITILCQEHRRHLQGRQDQHHRHPRPRRLRRRGRARPQHGRRLPAAGRRRRRPDAADALRPAARPSSSACARSSSSTRSTGATPASSRCSRWTQDLFLELATTDEQLDFPVIYAIAREGIAALQARRHQHRPRARSSRRSSTACPPPSWTRTAPSRCWSPRWTTTTTRANTPSGASPAVAFAPACPSRTIDRDGEQTRGRVTLGLHLSGSRSRRGRRGQRGRDRRADRHHQRQHRRHHRRRRATPRRCPPSTSKSRRSR